MNIPETKLHIGDCIFQHVSKDIVGDFVYLLGEWYYCIKNYDQMPPFFMNLVSNSDHWIFISSSGGLSAGRRNAESALFPYYTVDKITENAGNTGHVSILFITKGAKTYLWEPFSTEYEGLYHLQRNLYKNVYGDKLVFEETNFDLSMTYRYSWQTSERYGFVKTVWLKNDAADPCTVNLLDGLQNLLPYGATTALQTGFSNLLNGYKRNELESDTGLGIFTLSSTLTDLAEPSESLMATTAWQVGCECPRYLLSTTQIHKFKQGMPIIQEYDVRGQRGAYLVNTEIELPGDLEYTWSIIAEVNQDSSDVVSLVNALKRDRVTLKAQLYRDIDAGTSDLVALVASADGLQVTNDHLSTTHHYANVLFNIMRGGIFVDNHHIGRTDLCEFIRVRNHQVMRMHQEFLALLPEKIEVHALIERVAGTQSADLERLCYEFLPLTFSRRHGDPSRPWNQFSINIKNPDGSKRLDYQGNWRDIFQNWEPLAYAYPGFVEGMISKFLNATTADGYNPYRITGDGVEWEAPAPDNPWANIGYWSDHQIIYLQKLLEISTKYHPEKLKSLLAHKVFSHTNVPYRIKEYNSLLQNWYDTINFNRDLDDEIKKRVEVMGTDGKLILDSAGCVFQVNMAEKLLILLLAKLSNFVPGGGIWMNTQRPEWNDANNALVGKGLSIVTLCYVRRLIVFFRDLLPKESSTQLELTTEVFDFFAAVYATLEKYTAILNTSINDIQRRVMMDELGQAGSDYRWQIYENGLSGDFVPIAVERVLAFINLVLEYVEHTIKVNKRTDNLYHAYNVLNLDENKASVRHLYEMLEGQVAILSSGLLSGEEALQVLQALRNSSMYRADQHSYMLYPDRDLPGFLHKNTMSFDQVHDSALITKLVDLGDQTLVVRDDNGYYHFNGSFRNARDVEFILNVLRKNDHYKALVEEESEKILALFEKVFDHNAFTGRSGTFFAYEGLGSIYWHMVSKLLLATQEVFFQAVERGESSSTVRALADFYYDIRQGIGFNKSPEVYGAFPSDPYSHTPAGQGAKQPGMTGQVKEECVTRIGELGVSVVQGLISFKPVLLRKREFLNEPGVFEYIDVSGRNLTINLPVGSLAFTFCQVPVVYHKAGEEKIEVRYVNGHTEKKNGNTLDMETSLHMMCRDGQVQELDIHVTKAVDE